MLSLERLTRHTPIGLTTTYGGLGPASTKLSRPEVQRDQDRKSSATMTNFSTPQKRLRASVVATVMHVVMHGENHVKYRGL